MAFKGVMLITLLYQIVSIKVLVFLRCVYPFKQVMKTVIPSGGGEKKTARDSPFSVTMLAKYRAYAFVKVGAPTSHKQYSIKYRGSQTGAYRHRNVITRYHSLGLPSVISRSVFWTV